MKPFWLLVAAALILPVALHIGGHNGATLAGVILAGAAIRGYVKRAGEAR